MKEVIMVGDKAPEFNLPSSNGKDISLKSCRGKAVVLYFYPKDDTPGCTKEAIAFSELSKSFDKKNALVLGVSKDDMARHMKFIAKHSLRVELLSDIDGIVCDAYGVWVEKSMYGRKYMGIERSTFLIDQKGRLKEIWRKVKVPGHAEKVLEALCNI
ncbi:MAG: thioredoxin-dependent thiol peroxidase [Rhodospirillaceae bacterium]|nr:thioredoxin-dependent thiol peroxidase [Rhodospirillaceae bacterium]|tara:strand:- start:954 stop:1424 length:471 start_codon:yes stop_codon:yes gene_type:complete